MLVFIDYTRYFYKLCLFQMYFPVILRPEGTVLEMVIINGLVSHIATRFLWSSKHDERRVKSWLVVKTFFPPKS